MPFVRPSLSSSKDLLRDNISPKSSQLYSAFVELPQLFSTRMNNIRAADSDVLVQQLYSNSMTRAAVGFTNFVCSDPVLSTLTA